DQIGEIDGPMHVVAFGERRGTEVQVGTAADSAFTHLRVEEWQTGAANEIRQGWREIAAAGTRAEHQQRVFRCENRPGRALDRGPWRLRMFDQMDRYERDVSHGVRSDVLGQFEMHRARTLLDGGPEGLTNERRNTGGADDLPRVFGQRSHRRDDVDD